MDECNRQIHVRYGVIGSGGGQGSVWMMCSTECGGAKFAQLREISGLQSHDRRLAPGPLYQYSH